jgi:putative transposase
MGPPSARRRYLGLPVPGRELLSDASRVTGRTSPWGITTSGKPAFVGSAPGVGESTDAWADFDATGLNIAPGPRLVELVDNRIAAFAAKYADLYPAAMQILLTDTAELTAYLRFPVEHHARVRHSNFIERTFGETKRRTKVIGRFPGETSAISLVWAVLDRASRGWRGLTMTTAGTRLLQDLRRSLLDPPRKLRPPRGRAPAGHADPASATA